MKIIKIVIGMLIIYLILRFALIPMIVILFCILLKMTIKDYELWGYNGKNL